MIDYDRDALQFEQGRIEKFAVTQKDDEGFLTNIIEKPSENQIKGAMGRNGYVGVSMNIFGRTGRYDLSLLGECPFSPGATRERNCLKR